MESKHGIGTHRHMNQLDKAKLFKSLHVPGNPVVLYNIWDAGSAKAVADAGACALATGSWSVAAAQGYGDGENIPLEYALQIVRRISESVDLPLSVDFEGGYATEPDAVAANASQVIDSGAIGINIEDQIINGEGVYAVAVQVERIKAVRQIADERKIPLFINARTDLFLQSKSAQHEELCTQAIEREAAYAEAGADGFFIPGLTSHTLIEKICQRAQLPINVMMRGELTSVKDVAALGVSRTSFGPGPFISSMSDISNAYTAIH